MTQRHAISPSRGRPRQFDPDVAVDQAMQVFWSKGYDGTALPDLLAATRLSRGSLYAAFGDKHGLFLQALDRYIAQALARIDEELSPDHDAFDGLRIFLAGYVERMSGTAGKRGCLVVATAMELAGHDPDVEKRIGHFFRSVETRLLRTLERARAAGNLADEIEPAHAARMVLSMVEGLRVLAKTGVDCDDWHATIAMMLSRFRP